MSDCDTTPNIAKPSTLTRTFYNKDELAFISGWWGVVHSNSNISDSDFFYAYNAAYERIGTRSKPVPDSGIFCDLTLNLRIADNTKTADVEKKLMFANAFKTLVGVSHQEYCSAARNGFQLQTNELGVVSAPIAPRRETFIVDNAMYDALIDSVKSCKRTSNAIINNIAPNQSLSKQDYDFIASTIQKCKQFKLEQALQQ